MDINDNFVNIKPEIKQEMSIHDIPNTSENNQIPIRTPTNFNRPTSGYAGLMSSVRKEDNFTPYESLKNEPINPFGIYLNLDCVTNIEEAIDKWETAFRVTVSVNKMDIEIGKHFLERSLLNSVLRFWQNMEFKW